MYNTNLSLWLIDINMIDKVCFPSSQKWDNHYLQIKLLLKFKSRFKVGSDHSHTHMTCHWMILVSKENGMNVWRQQTQRNLSLARSFPKPEEKVQTSHHEWCNLAVILNFHQLINPHLDNELSAEVLHCMFGLWLMPQFGTCIYLGVPLWFYRCDGTLSHAWPWDWSGTFWKCHLRQLNHVLTHSAEPHKQSSFKTSRWIRNKMMVTTSW